MNNAEHLVIVLKGRIRKFLGKSGAFQLSKYDVRELLDLHWRLLGQFKWHN